MRRHQALRQDLRLDLLRTDLLSTLERADPLHQRFFEGAADSHCLADRLHLRPQALVGTRKFFKLPFRDLHDYVVERRLKAGWGLLSDVVGEFVERIADGKLGGDLRDWEPGRLRRQCRRARYARVHLDHYHASGGGMHAVLDVRSAGLDPDLADDFDGSVAHRLVFPVSQRLRRRHRDGVASMYAHGIEVLDRADDDHVVRLVADYLQLVLLPPEHALLDQHFVHRREVEAARQDLQHLFTVVSDAAARAAQRERRADDHREADLAGEVEAIFQIVRERGLGDVEADLLHRVLEK